MLFLYINWITLGVCVEPRQLDTSEFIGCRFDGPPVAAPIYLTNSAKRKKLSGLISLYILYIDRPYIYIYMAIYIYMWLYIYISFIFPA